MVHINRQQVNILTLTWRLKLHAWQQRERKSRLKNFQWNQFINSKLKIESSDSTYVTGSAAMSIESRSAEVCLILESLTSFLWKFNLFFRQIWINMIFYINVNVHSVVLKYNIRFFYICIVYTAVLFQSFSRCILSNTTRQILIKTHYIGAMFGLIL
jgi:hypothetical protein